MSTTPLRLQRDAYIVDLPDGVELVTGRGTAFLPGEPARLWVRRVLGALDGRRSLDEILARASPAQRELAERIVSAALGIGAVQEVRAEQQLGADDRFAAEIGFLGMYVPDPHAAFDRHRRRSVTVLAPPGQVDQFRDSFACTGIDISVAGGDPDVVVQVVDAPAGTDAVERRCRETGAALVQLVLDGPTAWWCPIGTVRWSDVRARLDGLHQHRAAAAAGAPPPTLVNMIVQDVFRPAGGPPAVVEFALGPGTQRRRPVRPHPFSRPARPDDDGGFRRRMAALARRPAAATEDFSRAAVTLMDSRVGLFTEITQGGLAQLPLKAAAATVSDPVGLLGDRLPVVTEADLDFPAARRQVGMRAIATYASLMVDPRRLVRTSVPASPWAAVQELRRGAEASVQALDLLGDRVVPVDARTVFPALDPGTRPYVASPGVGVGLGWRAAVADGLLQHCTRLTVERMATDGRIDVRAAVLPARARRALTVLDGLGRAVEVYDIGGTLEVPALVCTLDGVAVAVACGASYPDAFDRCLLAALRTEQDPAPDLQIPSTAREAPLPTPPRLTVEALARRLAAVAGPPLVVPLDHDPELTGALPVTVRVVLGAR